MVIISDTNILSSLAAANALPILPPLFACDIVHIPPAVEQELQDALAFGKQHVGHVFQALEDGYIRRITLTAMERSSMATLPAHLHAGEREGIALCQARNLLFLSNDRRALHYCEANGIEAINLIVMLRSLWLRQIATQNEVKVMIETMAQVEKLTLSDLQRTMIFAPHPRHSRSRRS
jgi:predicted nucleic acid-binding protein